ncbi:MAG: ATP-binding protein [Bacteroidota bacterium]
MSALAKRTFDQRIEEISTLIFEVANGNFNYTIDTSEENDELDAIVAGVNMLGQELKKSTVSRDHMESVYDAVVDMIIITDIHLNLKEVNNAYAQTIGFKQNELVGESLATLIDMNQSDNISVVVNQMDIDCKYQSAEMYFKRKDGTTIPTTASFSYLKSPQGEKEGIMIVAKDISRMKETERNLIKAKEAAEEANLAKGRFLSNMSHEIRTPLNGIIGFTELLSHTDLNESQKESVDMINNSSHNLSRLLNDVLDLNKIDLDLIDLEEIPYDFEKTFRANLSPYVHIANEKGIDFSFEFSESFPTIIGDPTRLNQVIINLVTNAIKFTEKGHVKVEFELQSKGTNRYLHCRVSDTGIGVPKEKQNLIFDRFNQSDNSITRKYGGTGLGLAISKQIIELMNGSIAVQSPKSDDTNGTTFEFTLPVQIAAKDQISLQTTDRGDEFLIDKELTILVADDNEVNLVLVKRLLEKLQISVITATDGEEAISMAKKQPTDLILMDIQMPVMDGLTATEILRKEKYGKPIIALSANVDKENQENIKKAGINDFLQKPFKRHQLTQVLKKWVN